MLRNKGTLRSIFVVADLLKDIHYLKRVALTTGNEVVTVGLYRVLFAAYTHHQTQPVSNVVIKYVTGGLWSSVAIAVYTPHPLPPHTHTYTHTRACIHTYAHTYTPHTHRHICTHACIHTYTPHHTTPRHTHTHTMDCSVNEVTGWCAVCQDHSGPGSGLPPPHPPHPGLPAGHQGEADWQVCFDPKPALNIPEFCFDPKPVLNMPQSL